MKVERSESRHDSLFARASARVSRRVCAQEFHGERGRERLTRRRRRRRYTGRARWRGWGSATADASTDSPPCHEGVHARTRPPSLHKIFFAHHCPCIHTLPRRLWPFQAHRGPPMHSLPGPSLSGCCPSIHSLSRPSRSSNTQACAPVAVLA